MLSGNDLHADDCPTLPQLSDEQLEAATWQQITRRAQHNEAVTARIADAIWLLVPLAAVAGLAGGTALAGRFDYTWAWLPVAAPLLYWVARAWGRANRLKRLAPDPIILEVMTMERARRAAGIMGATERGKG